jgi:hypothetical protein
MHHCRFAPTANRSVVGIMNQFSYLADVYRHKHPDLDLLGLGWKLASTPCSPLYRDLHLSPRNTVVTTGGSCGWAPGEGRYHRHRRLALNGPARVESLRGAVCEIWPCSQLSAHAEYRMVSMKVTHPALAIFGVVRRMLG